jgi:hypothetical protein
VTRTVGVDWQPVHNGMAEIAGIDDEVLRHFSRRARDIAEHLQQRGIRSMKGARVVKLETRKAKNYDVPVQRLRDEWRARASEMGLGQTELGALCDRRAPGSPTAPDPETLAAELSGPGGLTREASSFDRRGVLRVLAEAHHDGMAVEELESLADAWLQSDEALRLEPGERRAHLGGARYSTPDMVARESRLLAEASARKHSGVAIAAQHELERALATGPLRLSAEQEALARRVTRSGDGIEVVRAAAGTGKTLALGAARDAWERSGVPVYGCSLSARAALELETLAGIDSTTVARLLADIDRGYGLRPGSVLVVDEAGLVGTRAIARLAEHAADINCKVLLVGDDRQLPEIDAGGAFRGLAEHLGAIRLHEVRRQAHPWDREALDELRRGRVQQWADAYRDHARIVARPTAAELREAVVEDWWESARTRESDAVMVAHRRADVAELNALARARMHRDGRLGADELVVGDRAFARGDRVIARRNDRREGVVNGMRAEVVDVDQDRRTVHVADDAGKRTEISRRYLDEGWLDHGYALTAHAAQGATVDRSFVLGSDDLYREWGYTALTRHRDVAKFYVVSPGSAERALPGLEPDTDPVNDHLASVLGQSRRKTMAIHMLATDRRRNTGSIEQAVRDTEERIARLSRQREASRPWQRKQRRELDDLIDRQHEAIDRWTTSAVNPPPPPLKPIAERSLDVDEARLRKTVLDPPTRLVQQIGQRPTRFDDREQWCRAVAALLADPVPVPQPSDGRPTIDDTGLEL